MKVILKKLLYEEAMDMIIDKGTSSRIGSLKIINERKSVPVWLTIDKVAEVEVVAREEGLFINIIVKEDKSESR